MGKNGLERFSAKQVGKSWGIFARRVDVIYKDGRVLGAQLIVGGWIILNNGKNPEDAKIKNKKYIK